MIKKRAGSTPPRLLLMATDADNLPQYAYEFDMDEYGSYPLREVIIEFLCHKQAYKCRGHIRVLNRDRVGNWIPLNNLGATSIPYLKRKHGINRRNYLIG
jgi:hypothetical protein